MIKKNDLILIGAFIIIALAIILFLNLTKEEGSKLLITIDGTVYDTLDLNEDITYTVRTEDGGWNTFEIKDGYVDMIDASCPDKLCVDFKKIHYTNDSNVCLPNKVVLEVIDGEDSEVDIIAQ